LKREKQTGRRKEQSERGQGFEDMKTNTGGSNWREEEEEQKEERWAGH